MSLSSESPEEAAEEAQQKQCDYLLNTDIAELEEGKTGDFGGMMGKISVLIGEGMTGGAEGSPSQDGIRVFSSRKHDVSLVGHRQNGRKSQPLERDVAGSGASFAVMARGMGFQPRNGEYDWPHEHDESRLPRRNESSGH